MLRKNFSIIILSTAFFSCAFYLPAQASLPAPNITQMSINDTTVTVDQPFAITVKGKNIGTETADFGGIAIQVREAYTNGVEVSQYFSTVGSYDASVQRVFWKNDTLLSGDPPDIAQYLHVEPKFTDWAGGVEKTLTVTVTPHIAGTYHVYCKMYLHDGTGFPRDPSGSSSNTDHQGEATDYVGSVTVSGPVEPKPHISLSTSSLTNSCYEGANAPSQSFEIWNGGEGTLEYSISDNVTWLSCSPSSGTSMDEDDDSIISVNYSTSSLPVGTHPATITVTDPDADNNLRTISVSLTVLEIPHTVSKPDVPELYGGGGIGQIGSKYSFALDGSECSAGHDVDYYVNWDDGTPETQAYSYFWLHRADHIWTTEGLYNIKCQAKCKENPSIYSELSEPMSFLVKSTVPPQPVLVQRELDKRFSVVTPVSI